MTHTITLQWSTKLSAVREHLYEAVCSCGDYSSSPGFAGQAERAGLDHANAKNAAEASRRKGDQQ